MGLARTRRLAAMRKQQRAKANKIGLVGFTFRELGQNHPLYGKCSMFPCSMDLIADGGLLFRLLQPKQI